MFLTNNLLPGNPVGTNKWEIFENTYLCANKTETTGFNETDFSLFVFGRISNLSQLENAFPFLRSEYDTSVEEFLLHLFNYIGETNTLSLLEGTFVIVHRSLDVLTVYNDRLAQIPVYHTFSPPHFCITTSILESQKSSGIHAKLKNFDDINVREKPENFSAFANFARLPANSSITLNLGEQGVGPSVHKNNNRMLETGRYEYAGEQFLHMLNLSVDDELKGVDEIGVSLSGGIDSSTVCALINRKNKRLYTYSIGTEYANEFKYSKIVANHLGSTHREKIIESGEVVPLIEALIFHNEIFDPLSIEILLPFGAIYQMAHADRVNTLATGYGADLILGGTLDNIPDNRIFKTSVSLIERTFWTNEFNTNYSKQYNINVTHPFWKPSLIHYGLNSRAADKVRDGHVKHGFRKLIDKSDLLPRGIVWRNKLGIHEGSSMKKLIQKATLCDTDDDIAYYIYSIFKNNLDMGVSLQ